MLVERFSGRRPSIAGIEGCEHLVRLHGQKIGVQRTHATKHSIELQRIEGARDVFFILELFLELHDHARQEQGVERALIGVTLPSGDLVFLIEPEADVPHSLAGKAGIDVAQIVERRKDAEKIGV